MFQACIRAIGHSTWSWICQEYRAQTIIHWEYTVPPTLTAFLEKSAFSLRKLSQMLLGIEEYQPCQKRNLRFLVIPSLWVLRASSVTFQIIFLSECDFLIGVFSPSVHVAFTFFSFILKQKFPLVVAAQLPLCFAFYFSSVLYLIGDISKRAEGQTFKFAALNGRVCLNWTSIQTAIKVPCFTALQQTEHGHATQRTAALQSPQTNPGEQVQPFETQTQDFCVSVWATWPCPSQSNSGQYWTDMVSLSLPSAEPELRLGLSLTWKRHFSFSPCCTFWKSVTSVTMFTFQSLILVLKVEQQPWSLNMPDQLFRHNPSSVWVESLLRSPYFTSSLALRAHFVVLDYFY